MKAMKARHFFLSFCLLLIGSIVIIALFINAQKVLYHSYTYMGTAFNGTDAYLNRGVDLTGNTDSKKMIFSCWLKLTDPAQDGTWRSILSRSGGVFSIALVDKNTVAIHAEDASFNNVLNMYGSTSITGNSVWHHIAVSVDLSDTAKRWIYIDGVQDTLIVTTYVDSSMVWKNIFADWEIMAYHTRHNGTFLTQGSLSEFYWNNTEYLDLSVSSNLQKFRSAGGKPVSLGSNGSMPTGKQPIIYLKNSFSTFQKNFGSGGDFIAHGTLTDDWSWPESSVVSQSVHPLWRWAVLGGIGGAEGRAR